MLIDGGRSCGLWHKEECLFFGDGGVVYVSGGSYSIKANNSMFNNCFSSSWGGAIFFDTLNSFIRMICSNSCSCGASFGGHFAYLGASQMNQVEYLSVSYCSHTTSGYYLICLEKGHQRVENTNSSMNNAYLGSAIYVSSPPSFTSSHCSFSNNKVSHRIGIYIFSNSGRNSMSYANFVHNNSPYSVGGIVYVEGTGSKEMIY